MSTESVPRRKKSMSIKDARIAGLYDLENTIGQGHFAVVKKAKHVFTQETVAVKIIDKSNLDENARLHIMQEVRCMKLVQHPNIVRLYEVIDTQTKLFLILELGDYDMHDFILKYEKGCPEQLAQQYFSQIIKAINYCHKLHVVHRDLKPENVVFFEKLGMVKLTDFGFSNCYEPGEQLRTSCGSLAYSAPEILLGDAYDAPAVDVWSLGVILYMLVVGRLPFQEANDSETLTKILDCRFTLPDSLSQACRNLIARMLVRDSAKRASLTEIANVPWVVQGDRGHAEAIPLIERHHLPETVHNTIIEQMVAGQIGSEDAILSSIENDEYNYVSATYYLLAERVLSSCRFDKAKELTEEDRQNSIPDEECLESADARTGQLPVQSVASAQRCRSRSNSWRATRRPCSILKEESEEELSTYYKGNSRHSSRNSSPAMSMFGGSVRDRLSPQYAQGIQDLLEVVRPMRRAASPESVRSSRSPSPPGSSSGRTSPSVSSLSLARLKSTVTVGGGMRKLSSSPHLLGICEEGEEQLLDGSASGSRDGHNSLLSTAGNEITGRTNRSASTGLVVVGARHRLVSSKSIGQQPTYSAVRMIRPRQAVVSPDVLRRYEGSAASSSTSSSATAPLPPLVPPRFFLDRSRRSTSCSSSEASDDEERKTRFLISAGRCARGVESRRRSDDDDGSGDGGVAGGSTGNPGPSSSTNNGEASNNAQDANKYEQNRSSAKEAACGLITTLHPIPEFTHLDVDSMRKPPYVERSATAERIVCAWTGGVPSTPPTEWLATPPRDTAPIQNPESSQWVRALVRAKSLEFIDSPRAKIAVQEDLSSRASSFEFGADCFSFHSDDHDSGQGSSGEAGTPPECCPLQSRHFKRSAIKTLLHHPLETSKPWHGVPCEAKVDAWLRTSHFSAAAV